MSHSAKRPDVRPDVRLRDRAVRLRDGAVQLPNLGGSADQQKGRLGRLAAARTPRPRTPSTSKSYARQHNRKAGARPACGRRRAGDRAGNAAVAEPSTSHLCSGQARRLRACINHRPRGTRLQSFRRSTRDDRCLMTPAQSSVSAPSSERN
jgi:hypothetical protein